MTVIALMAACFTPIAVAATPDDKAAIRALEDRFAAAFNAGDIDGIIKSYVPDKRPRSYRRRTAICSDSRTDFNWRNIGNRFSNV